MIVLARHSARLGQAGLRLEAAVKAAVEKCEDLTGCWRFLHCPSGWTAYQSERSRFEALYNSLGRLPVADRRARALLSGEREALKPPPPRRRVLYSRKSRTPASPSAVAWGSLALPTHDIRFAHDDQSELFGRGREREPAGGGQSLLQLAVELAAGLTTPEDVPPFSVCPHDGLWFCRSGNRRLAAWRLAQRFAPARLANVVVKAVAVDPVFLQGAPGRRPKLTTHLNGPECNGQWLVVRETGERVGRDGGVTGEDEYGADLLALLPSGSDAHRPPSGAAWEAGGGG